MLRCTRVWPCAVLTVTPSLVRRAVALRWEVLGLRWDGETNMCVLADGRADGLPRGMRLEMYGAVLRLAGAHSSERTADDLSPDDLAAVARAVKSALPEELREGVTAVGLSPQTPSDGVIAEWLITTQQQQQTSTTPLMENGVVFESPRAAGLRALRAARQTFAHLFLREMKERQSSNAAAEPIALLDVSEADCAFSRVAVHVGVEGGLELERDFHVSYVPLSEVAATAPEENDANITSLLRLVAHPDGRLEKEPLRALQSRYFVLGCYTAHSGRPRRVKGEPIGLELAHVISKLHRGSTLLVNLLGGPQHQQEQGQEMVGDRKDISLLQREVKAVVTEALSRSGRWGVIIDEVLPAADCYDAAVSVVVSLD
ncbi:hypothetical protein MOQ_005613 [Trypanosoma cruzi marinkellei]|uniref:Uncharacterized protein n=1 Tax=Trypanosoma cruzi marinkellei TaxID=85056 RepID=K2NNZ7_TRYCR|nr:hypothetical protein MOQ_005613 [Trypanosoma cruzi marinkellei]